jgi:uncharacterized SAM-binding protein YcdF (DUF218 family)
MVKIILKFIVSIIINPIAILLILNFWFFYHQIKNSITREKKIIIISINIFFIIITMNPTASYFVNSLENNYKSLLDSNTIKSANYIVILGGGYQVDHFKIMPESNQLDESSLARLVEGIRLKNINPKAKLIFSGCQPDLQKNSVAYVYQKTYKSITNDTNINILSELPNNTKLEAEEAFKLVGNNKLILVTSASHMPRAMYLFVKAGCNVIPAPCHYSSKKLELKFHLPNGKTIDQVESTFHEYIGILWYKLFE